MNKKFTITSERFKEYGIEEEYEAKVPWKLKAAKSDAKNRFLTGYAGTIGRDRAKDNILIEAWKKSKDDLMQPGANTVFFNHDTDKPIGRVMKTLVDKVGLLVKVYISKAKDVEDTWTKIQEKVLSALSIRLRPKKVEIVEDADTGRIIEFQIKEMELYEVSVVGIPMNAKATINEVMSKSFSAAKKKYNLQRSRKVMKKKSVASVNRQVLKDMVGEYTSDVQKKTEENSQSVEALKKLIEEQTKSIAALAGVVTEMNKKTMTAEEKKAATEAMLAKQVEENPAIAFVIEQLAELRKSFPGRKGSDKKENETQDEENEDQGGVPKKCLKSAEDPDTLKYVLHILGDGTNPGNAAELESLTPGEKSLASQFYMQAMVANLSDN